MFGRPVVGPVPPSLLPLVPAPPVDAALVPLAQNQVQVMEAGMTAGYFNALEKGFPVTIASDRAATPIHHKLLIRPDLKDLDALPFPAWDLVDIPRYRSIWMERHGYYSMNLATSRGCPYHCNWCAKPIWGQRYHVRSADNVVAELAWLKRTYKPDHVWFVDDIFGLIPGWVERFANLVEQQHARVPFKSLQRADLILKGNTIDALRRAGAQRVWVGAESGSQKILDAMEKDSKNTLTALAVDGGMSNSDLTMQVRSFYSPSSHS